MNHLAGTALLIASLALYPAAPRARAAADISNPAVAQRTGTITGRIQNVVTGQYLNNARVSVQGTDIVAFTDQTGTYRLTQVPAGNVVIEAFYTGLDRQEASIQVGAGATVTNPALEPAKVERPKPDFADVRYGPHERNVLDLWLPKTTRPSPLVIVIHGGGFRRGEKSVGADTLQQYQAEGWAVAALNYRLTDTAPAPAAYLDCARALQFLRHNAQKWRIDTRRVASTGRSAGAGTSLWLALHDDLADPRNADPPRGARTTRTASRLHPSSFRGHSVSPAQKHSC